MSNVTNAASELSDSARRQFNLSVENNDAAPPFAPLTVDHLLTLVEPYREKHTVRGRKVSIAHLSTLLFDDGKRLSRMLEKNGDIGSRHLVKAFRWFSDHWPDGAVWPVDIPRPATRIREIAA